MVASMLILNGIKPEDVKTWLMFQPGLMPTDWGEAGQFSEETCIRDSEETWTQARNWLKVSDETCTWP